MWRYMILFSISLTASLAGAHTLDPHRLPLGNGKVSSEAKRGYVYSCQSQFNGRGAQHAGEWIHETTWDMTEKLNVQGDVHWPNATFSVSASDNERRLVGNGLPLDHGTGVFPVQSSDPAFQYDRNPNSIQVQHIVLSLTRDPVVETTPGCLPMGMIGVSLDGVAFFNALDAAGLDAVANEVQDKCNGHPQREGQYHYHGPSSCVPGATEKNTLVGYALDGFGIYSSYDDDGKEISNDDLDECHGRTSAILWDGKRVNMYHYVLTREYPYTVGCFWGRAVHTPIMHAQMNGPRDENHSGMDQGRRPPREAIDACSQSSSNARCEFVSPRGDTINGTCHSHGDTMACTPDHPPGR